MAVKVDETGKRSLLPFSGNYLSNLLLVIANNPAINLLTILLRAITPEFRGFKV
ncbi:hypothetical protein H6F78_16640 [Coleofasciculus sp. FACHB-64]|uniref:hypothetical protein n=1 Tax=Cyanophyceae TaxID=3028117 RepID=UPI0016838EB9|nr:MULTISPECIES: hypothetical protein [unclassified Coleofasciculus]MBD1837549.1 hypothetical protein [Coleofasciculus sp. FACHB-501]MBD2047202.1 hypothetical protein [Coleofasciculus sp. FACHB-64]